MSDGTKRSVIPSASALQARAVTDRLEAGVLASAPASSDPRARRLAYFAAVLACFGWGSLYTAAKIATGEVTGLMISFNRSTIATLILVAIVVARAGGPRPGFALLVETVRSARWGAVQFGIINFAGTSVLAMLAQQYLPASVNGLVNNLGPLWLSIWAATTGGAGRPVFLILGSVIAAIGVSGVLLGDELLGSDVTSLPAPTSATWVGVALSLSGSVLIAYQNYLARRVVRGIDPVALTAAGAAIGSLATGAVLAVGIGGSFDGYATVSMRTVLALGWLGTFATAFNFTLWTYALSVLPVARIANLQYIVPPLSVVAGFVVLGEPVGPGLLAGAVAILGGIFLAQRGATRD